MLEHENCTIQTEAATKLCEPSNDFQVSKRHGHVFTSASGQVVDTITVEWEVEAGRESVEGRRWPGQHETWSGRDAQIDGKSRCSTGTVWYGSEVDKTR